MRKLFSLPSTLLSICVASGFLAGQTQAQTSGVLREVYTGIGGVAISDLTGSAAFPSNPSAESILSTFEAPTDVDENYGQRLRALIQAPTTGNYTFWIASDDAGQLFLSTTDQPQNKISIATVPGWTSSREWGKYPEQKSAAITLSGGHKYYIEALMKEGGGGDNLAVRWQLPNGTMEEPIPGSRLTAYGLSAPQITQQPSNLTVVEGTPAAFTVQLSRATGATYQWRRNNAAIPGATQSTYILPVATLADTGASFLCVITNPQGSVTSASASLAVVRDTSPPTIVSVANLGGNSTVSILFSEAVEASTATQKSNFQLNNGAGVLSAVLDSDARTVVLTTTPMTVGVSYTLTINSVRDRGSIPNTIAPNSQASFTIDFTPLDVGDLYGRPESPGPSSRRTGLVISEIMYHPAARSDGKDVEFVEIYNSQPFFEDISNFRLSGEVDFTFPPGTKISARSYLVVAKLPADVQSVYGIGGVFGPYEKSLKNSSGVVRLRNHLGAVLIEATYETEPPFPRAADGAGHSLVLVRPSYGERDPRAWAASNFIGGSPGTSEPSSSSPYRTVVINEFLAHTDDPELDYIELYNYSAQPVTLGGCFVTDDVGVNKFTIPSGTTIPAKGFVVFNQNQLGFSLNAAGETIYLRSPGLDRIIDAIHFKGQDNGVSTGRYPDGSPDLHELSTKTPGAANGTHLIRPIVINEVMYNPISGNDDDQFVELHNRSVSAVDLSGWRLTDGVDFKFPASTVLLPGGHLVVARNALHLRANYSNLTSANTLGDFDGRLSSQGERLRLDMPDLVVSTNSNGILVTNTIHIIVDEVTYGTGGRWGNWSDGGGSSLELIDPDSNHRLAPNWADSDESSKSAWTTVQWTGVLDNGNGAADSLQLFLQGPGECLVDNIEVFAAGGQNLIANSTLESGADGWFFQGTHDASSLETTEGFNSGKSLHIRAAGRGDTGANRVRTQLTTSLNSGQTATLRARVRWLKGNPEILLRLHGNWLEAFGNIVSATNLGTPGARNSRHASNAGPAIYDVTHSPVLPSANQSITVKARVHDPDGIATLLLSYRLDPATNITTVGMVNNGAGLFSGTIPGQSSGSMVAFTIKATDGASPNATILFPSDAPVRECLIRVGEPQPAGTFGTYHLWFTKATQTRWSTREKNSNKPLDATFIYNNERVVYNIGTLYSGSPWHTPGFNSPIGNNCDYVTQFPDDQPLLGANDLVLATVGNLDSDDTAQREQAAFWILGQLGAQNNYRRHIRMYVNGGQRARIFEDSQQPNSDIIDQWFPDNNNGDLHKIEDWFEFDASGDSKQSNVDATLQNFTTTGGVKKLARYRWNWRKRAVSDSANAYTNLFKLVDALNTQNTTAYTQQTESQLDVEQWARVICLEHIAGNWDAYGTGRGKNMYAYKPDGGRWQLFAWDIDFVLGSGSDGPQTDMFSGINDPTIQRFLNHAPFRRAYFRAMYDAVNGPMLAANIGPILDAKYSALQANGISVASPSALKSYIEARRQYILTNHLAKVTANFALTINGGADFTTNKNSISLTGTAPVGVQTIEINGVSYPLTWATTTSWSMAYALGNGVNKLNIQGYDSQGRPVAGTSKTVSITYSGAAEQPQDFLVINEIMYNATVADASFVEIHNRSLSTAFDLSGWRLDGADFTFPDGVIVQPGGFVVIVNDTATFATTYGSSIPIAGIYKGKLQNGGETLTLVKPGATPELDLLIDSVTYDNAAPWPATADGFGPSLQLIDPAQDNNRVLNWSAVTQSGAGGGTPPTVVTQSPIGMTSAWKYNQAGNDLGTAWRERSYNDAGWSSGPALLYVESAALPATKSTALTIGPTTYYFRNHFNFSGNAASTTLTLNLILDDGAVVYLNGTEIYRIGLPDGDVTYSTFAGRTVSDAANEGPFTVHGSALLQGDNVIAVEVHQVNAGSSDVVFGLSLDTTTTTGGSAPTGAPYSPGAANSVKTSLPAFPTIWLNEVQPNNASGPVDRMGDRDPWVELYNSGTTPISLSGYSLSDDYANLQRWNFPAGFTINAGQRVIVWLDGEPTESTASELHTSFRIAAADGSIILAGPFNGQTKVIDYLNYKQMTADRSLGAFPDGTSGKRQRFYTATPGAANNNTYPPVVVFINEWMAANTLTLTDPADNDIEDWFELYNGGNATVDLSGFTLTDDQSNPAQWIIPNGTTIPAGGYLLVWADGEPGQNGATADLHTSFKLSQTGEGIALYNPAGTLVDTVAFAAQSNDVSQGRWPDGNTTPFQSMVRPTPRARNIFGNVANNNPPVLAAIGNKSIAEGAPLTFAATAQEPDAGQVLKFTLDAGAPGGATINASSGIFTWTPTEQQGPATYNITIRVTDDGTPALSDVETITVTVNEVNAAPTLAAIGDRAVAPGVIVTFTAEAKDTDVPAQAITFSLDAAPVGASINPGTGVFSWTPTVAQAGKAHSITVVAADNGTPSLNAARTFSITVVAGNAPPLLTSIGSRSVAKGGTLEFIAVAKDTDIPTQTLTFSLGAGSPEGTKINPSTGAFSWTPSSPQGPGVFPVTISVTDNGNPPLSTSETFLVTVSALNTPPVFASFKDQRVVEGKTVSFLVLAGDRDVPAQNLTYTIDPGAPAGAKLDPATLTFNWTTTEADGPGTYPITIRVTDDGAPPMTDAKTIIITVTEANTAPSLDPIPNQTATVGSLLKLTARATDADLPPQKLTFALVGGVPSGATIDPSSGQFQWTPAVAQASQTFTITVRVTDESLIPLSNDKTFNVSVGAAPSVEIVGVSVPTPGTILIKWTSQIGQSYRVQYSTDLGSWLNLGTPITASSAVSIQTDLLPPTTEFRFYRIILGQ